ncbi:MAG TPA: beta-propeller domain-containing protein, partial [Polyangiaceae bacterium]|nr:beta-propeller domain-containing protein [Polyangiaceae bacterium]
MNAKTAFVMLAASGIAAFAMGCGGAVAPVPDDDAIGRDEASLRRMKSCGELLTELRSDSKFKLNKGIDLQIAAIRRFGANGGYYGGVGMGGFGGDARAEGSSSPTAPPAPNAGSGSGTGSTPATPQATDHSGTTTQVAGVDEADFVKADNQNLYLLHGADLKVLRAWPKESMAELGSAK